MRQHLCIFRIGAPCSLFPEFRLRGAEVSQFLSVLLLAMALMLTVCFGVAAWRLSDEKGADITGQIPHQSYGWRPTPAR
ncbi:hypothetical protein AXW67_21245 [Bradyrhizobium neotropicale]|uniref:Uncharacterized protein n=1 Tax=Bradyrhizobium neotropicale TaxID=1497615 RepID=A0A176YWN7_9BRAD|nr:hypothetical protein AXW67_21245 [Bradyrhizobium neotropicale]